MDQASASTLAAVAFSGCGATTVFTSVFFGDQIIMVGTGTSSRERELGGKIRLHQCLRALLSFRNLAQHWWLRNRLAGAWFAVRHERRLGLVLRAWILHVAARRAPHLLLRAYPGR